MSNTKTRSISLTNLTVNIENPRFEMVGNQREAINIMIDDQGPKLINLASDILEHGLNPADLTIVTPHEKEKGKYNVLEGNRRATALKLLATPDIIDDHFKNIKKKFKEFSKTFKKNPITDVQCVIFDKQEDAYKWIELKHTGENNGIGTVGWDPQQSARFKEKVTGKSPIAIQALDFLKNSPTFDSGLKKQLKDVPSTTLVRLLGDKDVKDFLGIRTEHGILESAIEKDEVVKGFTKIIKDLLKKDFKVKQVYDKEDRLKYLETFKKAEIPDKSKTAAKPWQLTASPSSTTSKTNQKKKSRPLSTDRKILIPRECILEIADTKTHKIYFELKHLEVDQFENAASVLFRVFIELSIDAYIDKKKIQGIKKMTPLKDKVEKVAQHMKGASIASDHELKGILASVSNTHSVLSIDTFNAYVHNRHYSPTAKDLKVAWENIQTFMEKLWENIA